MDFGAFALPILPGKTEPAMALQEELEGRRKRDYSRPERARGIVRELWFVQETPLDAFFVVYLEGPMPSNSSPRHWMRLMSGSSCKLVHVTGIDVSTAAPGSLGRLVSRIEAAL